MKMERGKRLYPNQNPAGKLFYKLWYIIDRDGSIHSRITLNVPDSDLREEIICKHYVAQHVHTILRSKVSVELISRDQPWDFEISFNNGDRLKIEITAIADDQSMFRKMKSEDRIMKITREPTISLHELEKLNGIFPNEKSHALINSYKSEDLTSASQVDNPYYLNKTFLFQGIAPVIDKEFGDLLMEAIHKKVQKNHPDKKDVILIIDNRTIHYELEDILESLPNYTDELYNVPFKEIWIYTGYYSDPNGDDAEYSFISIKAPHDHS